MSDKQQLEDLSKWGMRRSIKQNEAEQKNCIQILIHAG